MDLMTAMLASKLAGLNPSGGGGGGGGVTDYNKLQNRPFGSNGVKTVDILPETTVVPDHESDGMAFLGTGFSLTDGNTYTVKWNGVDYECVCFVFKNENDAMPLLGNYGLMLGMGDTGEPFIIMVDVGTGVVLALDGSETVTLSISSEGEDIDRMEGKFLPEGTPYIEPFDDVILPETVLADVAVSNDGNRRTYNLSVGNIIVGNIYNIVMDGVTYQAMAYQAENCIYLGNGMANGSITEGVPYSNAPFGISIFSSAIAQIYGCNVAIEWIGGIVAETMAIRGGFKVNKLDKWCLPDITTPLVVTLNPSGDTYTADLSSDEVQSAARMNRPIVAKITEEGDSSRFYLCSTLAILSGHIIFSLFYSGKETTIDWFGDTITVKKYYYTEAT